MKENFRTREPYFYRKLYETKFRGDTTHDFQKIGVLIGNERINKIFRFRIEAPLIKYHQKRPNICCLSSLASGFHYIDDTKAVTELVNRIEESLTLQKN